MSMEPYEHAARAHAVDRLKGPPPKELSVAHLRILEHQQRSGITAGFELWWDEALMELEAWGLMSGQWIGSLAYDAHPFWSITDRGRQHAPKGSESL